MVRAARANETIGSTEARLIQVSSYQVSREYLSPDALLVLMGRAQIGFVLAGGCSLQKDKILQFPVNAMVIRRTNRLALRCDTFDRQWLTSLMSPQCQSR